MKKHTWIVLLLVIAMLVPSMAIQAQDDEVVTVTWWGTERGRDTAATRDMHFQLARAFEEANPNIKVAVALFPSRGFGTRIATAVAGGEAPDLWYTYYSPDIAEQGFIENLTPYIEEAGINPEELWFPIGQVRTAYGDQIYGLPRDASAGFIAYSQGVLTRAARTQVVRFGALSRIVVILALGAAGLALGGALGAIAVATKHEIVLAIVGGIGAIFMAFRMK